MDWPRACDLRGVDGLFVGPPTRRYRWCGSVTPTPPRARRSGSTATGSAVRPRCRPATAPSRSRCGAPRDGRERRTGQINDQGTFEFVVAEPGWTMHMISHFHYDPVWWNTQAAYTSVWAEDPPGRCKQNNAFALVATHLEMAGATRSTSSCSPGRPPQAVLRRPPARPRRAAEPAAAGRVEDHGRHLQRTQHQPDRRGDGDPELRARHRFPARRAGRQPATAWQLDVFGHDPQFPGMAADAGLTSSGWARGRTTSGGRWRAAATRAACSSAASSRWIAPSGLGLLTHYMPAHYAAGWWMDSSTSLAEAERPPTSCSGAEVGGADPQRAVAGGHRLHPPNAWVTDIHRDWNAATPGRSSSAPCRGSSSPPCVPTPQSAGCGPRRRPGT